MHKKDLKMCLPFADIDDLRKMDERILSVPPVYDSSFDEQRGERRWQESSDMAADQGFIFDGCRDVISGRTMAGYASNSSCDRKGKKLEVADNCNGRFYLNFRLTRLLSRLLVSVRSHLGSRGNETFLIRVWKPLHS